MKIRKAILTGGGRATRLHPLTTTINKHLIPLANKPMIFHAIEKAVDAGITEIYINTNPGETSLQKHIGDGGHWGIKIHYFEQTGGPQGVAHVPKVAEEFIGDDPFLLYFSDNILLGDLKTMVNDFSSGDYDCMLALSEVPDPERFGVPVFNENNELVDVWEKPENPPNNYAVTGIYLYGPKIFYQSFDNIKKSDRGEYEISSIHSDFIKRGLKVGYKEITGWWKDTGKPEDLLLANQLLMENMLEHEFPRRGDVHEEAILNGNVHIGAGSKVTNSVKLHGPVIVGENCVLDNCEIGPNVTIGSGVSITDTKINDSIILDNARISVPIKISKSLIGKSAELKPSEDQSGEHRMIVADKTVIEM